MCIACGRSTRYEGQLYCSNACQHLWGHYEYIREWLDGKQDGVISYGKTSANIKRFLREIYGDSCQRCGWNKRNSYTGLVPIELNHIDGDYTNNQIENLELICPNCHSLTGNYKARNKGKSTRKFNVSNQRGPVAQR